MERKGWEIERGEEWETTGWIIQRLCNMKVEERNMEWASAEWSEVGKKRKRR